MRKPDIEGIREFSLSSDRDSARFFVGREEVLDNINYAWQFRMKKWTGGETMSFRSATRVVQGAPGAGKTSVGTHLSEKLWKPRGKGKKFPHVVVLSTGMLNNPLAVFMNICEKINPDALNKLRITFTIQHTAGGGIDKIIKAGYERQAIRQERDMLPIEWTDLRTALGNYQWDRPVCLLIDEAQTLEPGGFKLLKDIHEGAHELPIFPLLMGLGNTETRLQEGNALTRPESGSVHTLPPLSEEQVRELCTCYFDTYRTNGSMKCREETIKKLYSWSDGWPSHMHNALKGLSMELLKSNGDLEEVNIDNGLNQARIYRQNYYANRVGDTFRTSQRFLGHFMTNIPSNRSLLGDDVHLIIHKAKEKAVRQGDQHIGQHSTNHLFARLLHQGFIQPDENKNYVCPIPSLRTWCLKQAGLTNTQETEDNIF